MHLQLINMDFQEGVVIKRIYYIHLHAPKYLHEPHVSVNVKDNYTWAMARI